MDQPKKTEAANVPPSADTRSPHESMDEFFNQIQSEMRRPDLSQEAVTAAFQAIQRMALDGEPEKPMVLPTQATGQCASCGAENAENARFCNACGSPLQVGQAGPPDKSQTSGQHHYHHHYHHHFFPGGPGATERTGVKPAGAPVPIREAARSGRTPLRGAGIYRPEAAWPKMTQA